MEKGIAFPTTISINNCVQFYSPYPEESAIIQVGDVVKVYNLHFYHMQHLDAQCNGSVQFLTVNSVPTSMGLLQQLHTPKL